MPRFESLTDEVRFLRGQVSVQRMADEVLEDCIERHLGLAAAADVFITQCARMIGARNAFVQLRGTVGPVLTRLWGGERLDVGRWANAVGPVQLEASRTLFVAPLNLGRATLGSLGFVLSGTFSDGGAQVQALVETMAETFDSALMAFMALVDGRSALEHLDEMAQDSSFAPRARFGKYELLHPLGTGGMAQVMVARSLGPEGVSRLVAVKRILPRLTELDPIVQQFLDEAKLSLKLNHPNLLTVYDFGQSGSTYFLAMELIKGVDLDRILESPMGPVPADFISAVMVQALAGLHAAHETRDDDGRPLELVHRDLSPHNIMVGFDGRVKVLDFGVAKMRNQRSLTLPGIVKGKPLYMSPEQAAGEAIDRRSDIFSMGLLLHEAVVGSRAFERDDASASMMAIVSDPLLVPSGVHPALWKVIERALAKEPTKRYQTAQQMAEAVARAVPPMLDTDVGALVKAQFPHRVAEVTQWERTLSRAGVERKNLER